MMPPTDNQSPQKSWYLVYTKPRQEALAQANLERQDYGVYLPKVRQMRRRRGKQEAVVEPLFPRYLFIHLDTQSDNWGPIRSTFGVASLVRFGSEPAQVPDELVAHLNLADYDLGGFSLGARTVVQAVGEGLTPRRAILAGMGLEGLTGWLKRKHFFLEAIDMVDTASRGDPHWLAIQFMKTMKVDLDAAKLLLPTFTDAKPDWLAAFTMPTLILCGTEDEDNGSAPKLAEALPDATYEPVPGTHMSSVTKPLFGEALARFCGAT